MTSDKIQQRLRELRQEYQNGEKQLANLHERPQTIEQTMPRIAGAIQVLEELTENSSLTATAQAEE